MKILIRSLFLAFILNFLMSSGAQGASDAPAKKTVLALFPYQNDVPYSVLAMQTIKEEFGSARDFSLDLYYEYLDLNRFPGKDYQQQILSLYSTKYGHKSIDLVIVATETVLNFWLEHRAEIAPTSPVVFCDVQTGRLAALQLPPDVTGVSGVLNHVQSVEWFLRVRPEVREIVTVHGVGPMDHRDMQALGTLQEVLRGRVKFTDLSDLPLVEIKRRVAALPRSSVVVYHLMFEDAAGNRYRPVDALRELAAASAVPVIGGFDHYIGFGTVGGYMYSMEQQTRQASQMGLSILRGKPVSAIPISKDQSNRFIFDHLALQRYNISLSALPRESILKNRQFSVWELYQSEVIVIVASFMVLLLLVTFLIVVTRRLYTARIALSCLNADLEMQVQERTGFLSQTNQHLELEMAERKQAEEKIKASLLEKETMLKEIHHRVKNNLQVISSLLNMQSSHLRDEIAREALQESMARVRTMAMIHTQLYQSQDLTRVDFGHFIGDLISNISQSYGRTVSPVESHVDAQQISLGIETSIPCGLILNELVSNALKHAFPEGKKGEINIRMRSEEGRVVLTVCDSGIGFPASIDFRNTQSLGLELVNLLVGQMNGMIDLQVVGGTTWTITFPVKDERMWQNG